MKTVRCRLCDKEMHRDGDVGLHDDRDPPTCNTCRNAIYDPDGWIIPLDCNDMKLAWRWIREGTVEDDAAMERMLNAIRMTATMEDPRAPEGELESQNFILRRTYAKRLLGLIETFNSAQEIPDYRPGPLVSAVSYKRFSQRRKRQPSQGSSGPDDCGRGAAQLGGG